MRIFFKNISNKKLIRFLKKKWEPLSTRGAFGYIARNCYLLMYPLLLFFWLNHIDKTWVIILFFLHKIDLVCQLNNDLKFLHPEVLHPTLKRYDSHYNSKFTYDLEEELKSLYEVNVENNIETKLQKNLLKALS